MVRRVDGASGVHDASVARRPCGPRDEGDGEVLGLVGARAGGEHVIPVGDLGECR